MKSGTPPDADDTSRCDSCGDVFRGLGARRHFHRHAQKGCRSVQLTYGWVVRGEPAFPAAEAPPA